MKQSMGMTKEEAERDQRFRPEDADPEGRDFTLDDVATLDPNLPEYIQKVCDHVGAAESH